MAATSIEWTDHSINPIRARSRDGTALGHHCVKISPGCANCYASRLQTRFGMPEFKGVSSTPAVEVFLDKSKLREVLKRRKPTRYFWCHMTDLFGDWVPDEWIIKCLAVMALTPWHTHQVLTRRPERMRRVLLAPNARDAVNHMAFHISHEMMCGGMYDHVPEAWPLPNVWLGVSVENQDAADARIPRLLEVPAAVRFLSCEPLLSAVDLTALGHGDQRGLNALTGEFRYYRESDGEPTSDWGAAVDWIICGGESGHGARPCNLAWVRSLVQQCRDAGVACFVKQLGSRPFIDMTGGTRYDDHTYHKLRDSKGGNPDEWPADLRVREFPAVPSQ